jgi:hypothetical protein
VHLGTIPGDWFVYGVAALVVAYFFVAVAYAVTPMARVRRAATAGRPGAVREYRAYVHRLGALTIVGPLPIYVLTAMAIARPKPWLAVFVIPYAVIYGSLCACPGAALLAVRFLFEAVRGAHGPGRCRLLAPNS